MNELQTVSRKIKLKRQAVSLFRAEVQTLQLEAALIKLRHFFEQQIDHSENQQALSRYLDMVEVLLQALRGTDDTP
jgi:DNA-directed RNA polymerase specialized sigma54-like protein